MATYFYFKPSGVIFSSQVGDIDIYSDLDSVVVQLTAPGKVVVLKERYYAHSKKITLNDIGTLIENNMRASGYNFAEYSIALLNADGSTADGYTMQVVYCDRLILGTDTDFFLHENFLTLLNIRRVPPDDTLSLFYFAVGDEDDSGTITCQWQSSAVNEGVKRYSFDIPNNSSVKTGVRQININQLELKNNLHSVYNIAIGTIGILSFTVTVGQRSMTCFVDNSVTRNDNFIFRNCFNVWDMATIPQTATAKTEVERSKAIVNSKSLFYNQQVTKSYEVQSGNLTSDEATWIDQLFCSHEVLRYVPNADEEIALQAVLITESTCEISNSDEKPNSVKFTWQYADNRIVANISNILGVFNDTYNLIFD